MHQALEMMGETIIDQDDVSETGKRNVFTYAHQIATEDSFALEFDEEVS